MALTMSESGVRNSCDTLVKKLSLYSVSSFSSATACCKRKIRFRTKLMAVINPVITQKYNIKAGVERQKGGSTVIRMVASCLLQLPSLLVPFTRKVYSPGGRLR